jgi:hypothetical protein
MGGQNTYSIVKLVLGMKKQQQLTIIQILVSVFLIYQLSIAIKTIINLIKILITFGDISALPFLVQFFPTAIILLIPTFLFFYFLLMRKKILSALITSLLISLVRVCMIILFPLLLSRGNALSISVIVLEVIPLLLSIYGINIFRQIPPNNNSQH